MKCVAIIIFGLFAAGIHSYPQTETRFKRGTSGESIIDLARAGNNDGIRAYEGDVDSERDILRDTALMVAAEKGNVETVKLLLEKGANIEETNNFGSTALILAAVLGRKKTIELLLEKGANIEAKNTYGYTALIVAALNGRTESVRVLLENGADPTKKGNDGKSAKDWAITLGYTEIVDLLNQTWTVHKRIVKRNEEHSEVVHSAPTQPIQQNVNQTN